MMSGTSDSLPGRGFRRASWYRRHHVIQDNLGHGYNPAGNRPFMERPASSPFGVTSIPFDSPYSATRVIVVGNNTAHIINPRFPHQLIPRIINHQETMPVASETDNSKLTKEEQEMVLKKLKKEIYNPMPKILARRVSLYYRDLNKGPDYKATGKQSDEDRKSCAVCLEDFEVREEVMVTPCSHMFHEECIVPWVKNHGQCPVCRATFYERRESGPTMNGSRTVVQSGGQGALFADRLFSLIQDVNEVFPWRI